MILAEREQLIQALLSGTLDAKGEQALQHLAQHDNEVKELIRQQELVKQGVSADRSSLVQAGASPQLRDQVVSLSKATSAISTAGAGSMVGGMIKWGAGLLATLGVAGVVYVSSLEDQNAQPVESQPAPAVTIEHSESTLPVFPPVQSPTQSSITSELERLETGKTIQPSSISTEASANVEMVESTSKEEVPATEGPTQSPPAVRNNQMKGKGEIVLPPNK